MVVVIDRAFVVSEMLDHRPVNDVWFTFAKNSCRNERRRFRRTIAQPYNELSLQWQLLAVSLACEASFVSVMTNANGALRLDSCYDGESDAILLY